MPLKCAKVDAMKTLYLSLMAVAMTAQTHPNIAWQVSVPNAGSLVWDQSAYEYVAAGSQGIAAISAASHHVVAAQMIGQSTAELAYDTPTGNVWSVGLSAATGLPTVSWVNGAAVIAGSAPVTAYSIPTTATGPQSISLDIPDRRAWLVSGGWIWEMNMNTGTILLSFASPDGHPIQNATYVAGYQGGASVVFDTAFPYPVDGTCCAASYSAYNVSSGIFVAVAPGYTQQPILQPVWNNYLGELFLPFSDYAPALSNFDGVIVWEPFSLGSFSYLASDAYSVDLAVKQGMTSFQFDPPTQLLAEVQPLPVFSGDGGPYITQVLIYYALSASTLGPGEFPGVGVPNGVNCSIASAPSLVFVSDPTDGLVYAVNY